MSLHVTPFWNTFSNQGSISVQRKCVARFVVLKNIKFWTRLDLVFQNYFIENTQYSWITKNYENYNFWLVPWFFTIFLW